MAGGTRIVAFDAGSQDASDEEILLTEQAVAVPWETDDAEPDERAPPPRRGWLLPGLALTALLAWTAFFGWAMRRQIGGASAEQWIGLVRDWAVPAVFIGVAGLLALRDTRREALRFGDAARLLSVESSRLEERLSVINRELSLAREFIAAESRDLETLGRLAADRLSAEADRLQGLIRDNHARVEAIGTVSEAALDNMEKLRGQLPVIASSAKDVTNNIGNAGRAAHTQLQDMINGFDKLNEVGEASARQVNAVRDLSDETASEFVRQADRMGEIAAARFAALNAQGAEFRTQLELHEVEALAAVRTRAAGMAEEVEATRHLLDGQEAESLTSMRARISALRDEGAAISRALRDGENRALKSWQAGVTRMKEDLEGTLVALEETEIEAAQTSQARIAAIGRDLTALDRQARERAAGFAAELAQRQAEAADADKHAVGRLADYLTQADEALAARHARQRQLDEDAAAALRAQLAAFDGEIAQRRKRHEAQGAAIAAQADAIAARLDQFGHGVDAIVVRSGEAEAAIAHGLSTLSRELAASRAALAGTDGDVAALTDASVRLLELIRASVTHSAEDLPDALAAGEARLKHIEARLAALRDAARDTDRHGVQLAETIEEADGRLRRTYADLTTLQAGLDTAGSAYGETLSGLRHELGDIAADSARLVDDTRSRLSLALGELARSAEATVSTFGQSGGAAVAGLARQLGTQSREAIEGAMRAGAAEASGQLESAASAAAAISREAAAALGNQLVKVDELAASLEARIAYAREQAEEQVDDDFSRRVALITESLNSNAIDIAKALSTDVADTAWAAYLRGDRGIFTRRAVNLVETAEAKAIAQIYERDRDFHEHVSRYIHDFEAMLRQVLSARDGNALGVTLLSSDMGKLYVTLAQAIERLR